MKHTYRQRLTCGVHGEVNAVIETFTDSSVNYFEVESVKFFRDDGSEIGEDEVDEATLEGVIDEMLYRRPGAEVEG